MEFLCSRLVVYKSTGCGYIWFHIIIFHPHCNVNTEKYKFSFTYIYVYDDNIQTMYTNTFHFILCTVCVLSIFMEIDNENLYENLPMQNRV